MNRTTLAASAILVSGLALQAHAQSNVTIYGIFDVPVEHLTNASPNGKSLTRIPGLDGTVPSRIGFRGTEDLGGGLKALFVLEQGLGLDTGTLNQGGRAFGRQAYVGLQNPWGTVSLGRQYSMIYWSQFDADILGSNMFGSSSLDSYLPNTRADNSVAYRGKFGGWDVGANYSFGRDAVNAGPSPSGTNCPGESATDKNACKQWSGMVKYDEKTWGAVAAIDQIRGGAGAFAGLTSSKLKDRRSTVAGWVRFDALKLGAGVITRHNDARLGSPHSNLWYVGAAYNVTDLFVVEGEVFKLAYGGSADRARLFAVRSTYYLSKRTAVYATAGHMGNQGVLATSVSAAAAGGTPPAGQSQNGVAAGVRHSF